MAAAGRAGVFVVLRLEDVSLVGERGTKIPNATIREIDVELEFKMQLIFEYNRCATATSDVEHPASVLIFETPCRASKVCLGLMMPRESVDNDAMWRLCCSQLGWHVPVKPKFDILFLDRAVKGNSVPLPRTLIRSSHLFDTVLMLE